jgi:two-component system NtrC family sensor kinase
MKSKIKLLLIRLLLITALAITYYGTAQISRIVASSPQNVAPVWPPDGFATAAILLFGYWIWPGVFIGSFMANFWAFTNHENINTLIFSIWQITVNPKKKRVGGGITKRHSLPLYLLLLKRYRNI